MGCKNLTSIPLLKKLTILNCMGCKNLTSIPLLKNLTDFYCDGCEWLNHNKNEEYNNNITKLKKIQKYFKNRKARKFIVYIKTKEFNEWFYHPNGIGGKSHMKNMLNIIQYRNKL